MSATVDVLSGLGAKAPAAILVETRGRRLLLDAGGALEPGQSMAWTRGLALDAILISHDHIDHIGGVAALSDAIPLYCTPEVARALPAGRAWRPLAYRGRQRIAGIPVTTGQAGHSLGGVWLHLAIGEGIFYSGDASLESALFPFDPPPPAALALLDASYGGYDLAQTEAQRRLEAHLQTPRVLPVPASGRALEMALWLHRRGRRPTLDAACRAALNRCLALPSVCRRPGHDTLLRQLAAPSSEPPSPWRLVADDGQRDDWPGARTLHTGYLTPARRAAVQAGHADVLRWNVHLRLSDLHRLVAHLGAREMVPLFAPLAASWTAGLPLSAAARTAQAVSPDTATPPAPRRAAHAAG